MKLLAALLLFLAFGFSSQASAAFPLTSDLTGSVVDANKAPIVGALVEIRHVETGRVITRVTNRKGRYTALNLRSDGTYIVRVMDPTGQKVAVSFPPGKLLLGERMRRNAVLLDPGTLDPPDFMRSWLWNQNFQTAYA